MISLHTTHQRGWFAVGTVFSAGQGREAGDTVGNRVKRQEESGKRVVRHRWWLDLGALENAEDKNTGVVQVVCGTINCWVGACREPLSAGVLYHVDHPAEGKNTGATPHGVLLVVGQVGCTVRQVGCTEAACMPRGMAVLR